MHRMLPFSSFMLTDICGRRTGKKWPRRRLTAALGSSPCGSLSLMVCAPTPHPAARVPAVGTTHEAPACSGVCSRESEMALIS